MPDMIGKLKSLVEGPLTDEDRRTLRTGYQAVVALIAIVPLLLANLNPGATVTGIVASVTMAAKLVNALESRGLIPAWLKGSTTAGDVVEPPTEEEDPHAAEPEDREPEVNLPVQTDNSERPEDGPQDVSQDPTPAF